MLRKRKNTHTHRVYAMLRKYAPTKHFQFPGNWTPFLFLRHALLRFSIALPVN